MSRILKDMIWQHDKVLPYLFGDLKKKIEAISPIEKIYPYGSRSRTPVKDWQKLEGKDWDILIVCKFPIVNTRVWTTELNYYIDLKITDPAGAASFFKYKKDEIELYPNNSLDIQ